MHIERISATRELQSLSGQWNALAGSIPFRSWEWLSTWWKHYGAPLGNRQGCVELFVLTVRNSTGRILGIAPWYLERTATQGKVVRFLGSGEVCSDYLSVLCQAADEDAVVATLAEWLAREQGRGASPLRSGHDNWDLLKLSTVESHDSLLGKLGKQLAADDYRVDRRPGSSCWRVELPRTWEVYVAMLSKSHRKQVRRLERDYLISGKAVLHTVASREELTRGWDILVDLHQRRRTSLGEPGCFASASFAAFHRDVAARLFDAGKLRLQWIELDGKPLAVEYNLTADGIIYAYQAGLDPEALDCEPGRLSAIATIKLAIEQGFTAIDFLRGDEPYKAHWRAEPRPTVDLLVVPPRAIARIRHGVRLAGQQVKHWINRRRNIKGTK